MDSQVPTQINQSDNQTQIPENQIQAHPIFIESGTTVIYGLHGKCSVRGVQSRTIGSELLHFYKLEVTKAGPSRSSKLEPAIWVPIKTAFERGLRLPMNSLDVEGAFNILASREYYFPLTEPWNIVHPKLENSIRLEGGNGLAKVLSFLYVLKKKQIVPSLEVMRLFELVSKLFIREVADVTGKPLKIIEQEISKLVRHKTALDH